MAGGRGGSNVSGVHVDMNLSGGAACCGPEFRCPSVPTNARGCALLGHLSHFQRRSAVTGSVVVWRWFDSFDTIMQRALSFEGTQLDRTKMRRGRGLSRGRGQHLPLMSLARSERAETVTVSDIRDF